MTPALAAGESASDSIAAASYSAKPTNRVVRGVNADRNATPWFINLNISDGGGWGTCGGTAISQRWVLTAAHCVYGLNGNDIARSYSYINPPDLYSTGRKVKWQRVIIHPSYDNITANNDVALIETASSMAVRTLPYSDQVVPIDTRLHVFGFGYTTDGGTLSSKLRQGRIQDRAGELGACGTYGADYVATSMLCAGDPRGEVDACQGDSGGPLTAWTGQRALVGIVSWGDRCGDAKRPGVYTRVSTFAPWIHSISQVAPHSASVLPKSPPEIHAHRVCDTKSCKVKRGGKVTVELTNSGDDAAGWSVKASKLGTKAGKQSGSAARQIAFKVRSSKKQCATVVVRSEGSKVATLRFPVNGARC